MHLPIFSDGFICSLLSLSLGHTLIKELRNLWEKYLIGNPKNTMCLYKFQDYPPRVIQHRKKMNKVILGKARLFAYHVSASMQIRML